MKRRDFLLSTAALGSLTLVESSTATGGPTDQRPPAPLAAGSEPLVKGGVYQAGSRAQLFVDQMVVRQADNVAFTLHPARKHPANPLVVADQPWEGWRLRYGSVIYDEQERLFKMWYTGDSESDFPGDAALYATSADGIHWQKPLVGTIAFGSFAAGTEAAIAAAAAGKPAAGKIAHRPAQRPRCRSRRAQRHQGLGRPGSGTSLQDDRVRLGWARLCARQPESRLSHLRFARWAELDAA